MRKILLIIFALINLITIDSFASNKFIKIIIDGGIGPASSEFIESALHYTEKHKAQALIIKLNTPGGLLESTRDIVGNILSAKVPVIVYICPEGARAGSAGVFITMAANIAVMSPGTNIGAAHPVGLGGESDSSEVMTQKITNDASAFMRTIAKKRNRNISWAERTVRNSISATENEALDSGAIDFICPNTDSLLKAVNGFSVITASGSYTLNTNGAVVEEYEQSWRNILLGLISDPNIAYILMLIGIYGILFELYNPGSIFPGIAGGISIILAGYSLQMLPVNYAGLALIILAVIMFLLEIKVTSYGMLSIGGVISFLLGSIMLINTESELEFVEISMSLIITATVLTAAFFLIVVYLGLTAQSNKKVSGKEAMIGEVGTTLQDFHKGLKGNVKVHGEIWSAIADDDILQDSEIVVTEFKGLKLKIKRKS